MPLTPLIPPEILYKKEIQSGIRRVERQFAEQIDHIACSFGDNSFGEPSVYFWVVVNDEAAAIDLLEPLSTEVITALIKEATTDEIGLHAYADFRSVSEQAKLQDPTFA